MKNKIFVVLLIIFFANLLFRIYQYRDDYVSRYDPVYWHQRYLHSQWVTPNSKQPIGDDGLYAYAGWEYIHGINPTTVNAEVPPLGKYLIGLSVIAFSNQNIFALLCGLFVLSSLYLLNTAVFEDRVIAFIPVVAFSFEPLFYTQLRAPFLDLLYLGFFLLTLNFFLRRGYVASAIFFGFMASTKNSLSTFLLVVVTTLTYLLLRKQFVEIKKYILSLPIALFIFLLSYTQFFLLGHSMREFLGVQKYIVNFYASGAKGNIAAVWQILMSGQWPTWFDGIEKVAEWTIVWPILLITNLCYLLTFFIKMFPAMRRSQIKLIKSKKLAGKWKENRIGSLNYISNLDFFVIWLVFYLLFLSVIPVFPRYLLLVLPFLYNVAVQIGAEGLKTIKNSRKLID